MAWQKRAERVGVTQECRVLLTQAGMCIIPGSATNSSTPQCVFRPRSLETENIIGYSILSRATWGFGGHTNRLRSKGGRWSIWLDNILKIEMSSKWRWG